MLNKFKDRKFQFWHYRVSHGELLLRSPKNMNESKNIDIIFEGVKYVELPRFLPKMEIGEETKEDLLYISNRIGSDINKSKLFVLISEQKRFFVVASIMKVKENEMDIFELPFEKLQF